MVKKPAKCVVKQIPGCLTDRRLVVGSICSGWNSEIFALEDLGIPFTHAFDCEKDAAAQRLIRLAHQPEMLLDDVTMESFRALSRPCDFLFAGFPCQPFSASGLHQGFNDDMQGCIIAHIIHYIQKHKPACFLLENVKGLLSHHKRAFLQILLALTDRSL